MNFQKWMPYSLKENLVATLTPAFNIFLHYGCASGWIKFIKAVSVTNLRLLVRHKRIYQRAQLLDKFIDFYIKARKRVNFPHTVVKNIVCLLFPNARYVGRGAFKTVHHISTRSRELVLKFSMEKNIKKDFEAYKKLPIGIRNRYFAKIYWSTRYCLLQKYGKKAKVPDDKLQQLKSVAKKHGLSDVRVANIRKVDGKFKIVDASVSE